MVILGTTPIRHQSLLALGLFAVIKEVEEEVAAYISAICFNQICNGSTVISSYRRLILYVYG
jgi:hypothetical protein